MKLVYMMITVLFMTATAAADSAPVNPLSIGVVFGWHLGSVKHDTAPTDSTFGTEIGPIVYYDLGKTTLRGALLYRNQEIYAGDDTTFFNFFDDSVAFEFDQFVLSLGAQYNFSRKVAIFGDLNYSLNTVDKSCYASGDNIYDFDCGDAFADIKDNVLSLKTGMSFRFVRWFRLEPYFNFSLTNFGKERYENSFLFGLNTAFAF